MEPVPAPEVLRWAETLSGIARTGLGFTQNLYERERFEEVLRVAADMRVAATEPDAEAVQSALLFESWLESVGEGVPGYVTPKSAVGAVVGDPEGRLLLVQRRDSGYWLYPTGWADVGYSPSEVALKEVAEETGVDVTVERMTGAYKNLPRGVVALVFRCRPTGGEATATDEAKRVRWLTPSEVEQHMDPAYAVRVLDALTDGVAFRAHDGVQLIAGV